ncbi:unnamed protein product [Victoria cruziana]
MEQLKTIGRELAMGSQGGWGQSREFLDLVKSIGECRSKAEEDRIVLHEIETLKKKIAEPDVPRRKMKEYIIRLVYVEMLGHDASFGYIHAVKMTHDDSLLHKRTGYLAVTLFLNEDHDLIILIVNTIQKDLKSDNYLVVCAALTAVCKLINEETIPAVLPQVVELLGHPKEAVRKKAVMALHRFYQRAPSTVFHLISNFRKRLCDNDPGVMGASLCPLFDLILSDVNSYKDLVVSFVSILKQVAERRLPKNYDYHQMPAPFIQIRLLKILALLGSGDKRASETMYAVLGDIFRKCETTSNIGNAVLYECICTVSSIYPSSKLLETAAEVTSRFLKSDNHNLKYMGVDALRRLVRVSPDIAEEHQLAVIDCLEDPDDTLKRKTFDLLYKMTKPSNVEVVVDRMIDYMINISDNHYKTEIASRCVELAEQFAPSNQWFIQTMNKVFEHAGDLVNIKVAHNLMRLIAEGFGEDDEDADSQLRSSAVESYLRIMVEPKLPSAFLQVICWVLGEYGTADAKYTASNIIGKLCDVAEAHSTDDTVKGYTITAIMKICAFEIGAGRKLELLPECHALINELLASHSTDLQQRAYELQTLLTLNMHTVENIMPFDASCEDIEVDKNISFLEGFIQQALKNGARPYIPESERSGVVSINNFRDQDHHEASAHSLRFEAYEIPKPPVLAHASPVIHIPSTDIVAVSESVASKESHQASAPPTIPDASADTGVRLRLDGIQKKWGRPSYSSAAPTTTSSSSYKTASDTTHSDLYVSSRSYSTDVSYNSRRPESEVSAEKQKLAASIFGTSSTKNGKKASGGSRASKSSYAKVEKVQPSMVVASSTEAPAQPPPDLLDLGEDNGPSMNVSAVEDPFKQLEGLLAPSVVAPSVKPEVSSGPTQPVDLMALYSDACSVGKIDAVGLSSSNMKAAILKSSSSDSGRNFNVTENVVKKGPSAQDSLQKDALSRQIGVIPSGRNPHLFKDLLG